MHLADLRLREYARRGPVVHRATNQHYCNAMFYGISKYLIHQLQLIQNACAKAVTGKYKFDHLGDDLDKLHWLNIPKRVIFKICLLSFKAINGIAPLYLQDMFKYAHHFFFFFFFKRGWAKIAH